MSTFCCPLFLRNRALFVAHSHKRTAERKHRFAVFLPKAVINDFQCFERSEGTFPIRYFLFRIIPAKGPVCSLNITRPFHRPIVAKVLEFIFAALNQHSLNFNVWLCACFISLRIVQKQF